MTLKETRIAKGISQVEASTFLNIPLRTYKRYESQISHSNEYKIKALIEALKNYKKVNDKEEVIHFPEIAIIGAGFVGYNTGLLLSTKCNVTFVDTDPNRVKELIKEGYKAVTKVSELRKVEVALICVPTNLNSKEDDFDTSSILKASKDILNKNKNALVVIKSTVNIGYSEKLEGLIKHPVYFMPEFLREKNAKEDSFNPTRLIIGGDRYSKGIRNFAKVVESCISNDKKTIFMSLKEAEATKLYSNAYLAMRVAFFNEIDNLGIEENLDTTRIIKAMGQDPRIGDIYNNPSFGFSGYCLPKDTTVLSKRTKSKLLKSTLESNKERKLKIVKYIISEAEKIKKNATIGFYGLESTKTNGKLRNSSTLEIIELLKEYPGKCIVFDKNYDKSVASLEEFLKKSDIVVTNSYKGELKALNVKAFTRSLLKY